MDDSHDDLTEAILRVGASAQDVGISFDQLIKIVVSAKQITKSDGRTIGNALKTVFARNE